MSCDQITDNTYINNFIKAWKAQSPMIGYDCVQGTRKDAINALDYINAFAHQGQPLSEWCMNCTTVQQTDNGYLTVKGALATSPSTSSERPLYYYRNDVASTGSLKEYFYNPDTKTWSKPTWPNVIVHFPADNIRVLDSSGNPTNEIEIRTVPVSDVTDTSVTDLYYLFVVDKSCSGLPMPVYLYADDTSKTSSNTTIYDWPPVGNDSKPYNTTFTDCPQGCLKWEWEKQD